MKLQLTITRNTSLWAQSFLWVFLGCCMLGVWGCKGEEPSELEIPDTYVFTREGGISSKFEEPISQLNMLGEMSVYMAETRRINGDIDGERLKAMFRNGIGADFSQLYVRSLLSKTDPSAAEMLQEWMLEMGTESLWQREAKEGQSGFLSETYGTGTIANSTHRGYLINENGIEYQQVIEIGVMGAAFWYQAVEKQLSTANMANLDNEVRVEDFFYTEMEHEYDAAFGYLGVPLDYPANANIARFWGELADTLRLGPGSDRFSFPTFATDLMQSFLRGRAALTAKEYTIRDEEIVRISEIWSSIIAGTALDWLEQSKSVHSPLIYEKHHHLSGAIACMLALGYHTGNESFASPFADQNKIEEALQIINLDSNLWQVSDEEIEGVIQLIQGAYPAGTFG